MGRHCVDAAFALHTLPSWVRISLLLPDFRAQCPEEQRCCLESEQHSACLEEKSLFLQCRDLFSSFLFSLGYLPSAQHVESITAAEWSRICFLCERTNKRRIERTVGTLKRRIPTHPVPPPSSSGQKFSRKSDTCRRHF